MIRLREMNDLGFRCLDVEIASLSCFWKENLLLFFFFLLPEESLRAMPAWAGNLPWLPGAGALKYIPSCYQLRLMKIE